MFLIVVVGCYESEVLKMLPKGKVVDLIGEDNGTDRFQEAGYPCD
jgi:hypothetical protein